jgi:DNA adenine methylase
LDTDPIRALPFLRWPGGKTWAADQIAARIRPHLKGTYYEPFLGGGAVFFALAPERAVLSDLNADLINTYIQIRDDAAGILDEVLRIPVTRETYDRIRQTPASDARAAAVRFLYLNRTAFSGLYRLNRKGEFNVPFGGGDRNAVTLARNNRLATSSRALTGATFRARDFQVSLDEASPGDVVFCDPTYTVAHDQNSFQRYNERVFSWSDQERLAKHGRLAAKRGAAVFISNAAHRSVRELYADAECEVLHRISRVSGNTNHRRPVEECLFTFLPKREIKHTSRS